jgi:hypothetical protein
MEALNQNDSSLNVSEAFSQSDPIHLGSDIHPTKVLFVKDKLPDGFIFPRVAAASILSMSGLSTKIRNPLS